MRSRSPSSGVAAYGTARAPSTLKPRSGMAVPQRQEEAADLFPGLGAPGEPAPVHADQANQPVAVIDRHAVMLADSIDAVDEERLDVRLQLAQDGVLLLDRHPRIETDERLGGPGGARIERHHPAGGAAAKEESEADRDAQGVPPVVVETHVPEHLGAGAHAQETSIAAREENGAGSAGTLQRAGRRVDEVVVAGRQARATQLAPFLGGRPPPDESAQRGEPPAHRGAPPAPRRPSGGFFPPGAACPSLPPSPAPRAPPPTAGPSAGP